MSFTSLPLELHDMVYGFLGVGIKTSTMEVDEKLSIRGRHSRPTDSGMVFKHFEAKRYSKLQSLIRLGATCKLLHAEIGDSLRGDGILEIAPGKLQTSIANVGNLPKCIIPKSLHLDTCINNCYSLSGVSALWTLANLMRYTQQRCSSIQRLVFNDLSGFELKERPTDLVRQVAAGILGFKELQVLEVIWGKGKFWNRDVKELRQESYEEGYLGMHWDYRQQKLTQELIEASKA